MSDPASVPPTVLLTEPQRRHFEVVLAKLETVLDEVDQLARLPGEALRRPALTILADDIPPAFSSLTVVASQTARDRIAALATRLGLAPQRASRLRTVRALLVAETVRLQDSFSSALKGYGALDSGAPDVIDPAIRELIALVAAMLRALDAPRQTGLEGDSPLHR